MAPVRGPGPTVVLKLYCNSDKYYLDLSSIEKDNNKRFYIRLRDYGKTDDYGENSSLIFVETNCENMESRFLKDVYFKDNMGVGEYITLDKKSDWMIFKSGSLGDEFNKFVCRNIMDCKCLGCDKF